MKKVIALLIIILLLAGGLYYWKSERGPSGVEPGNVQGSAFAPDAASATFTFDNQDITLSQGQASQTDPETGEVLETDLLDEKGYGDLNNDGKQDTVVLLSQSGSGSGVFIYAAAYVSGPLNYKGTNTISIGDRVSPQTISVSKGVITIHYLDRKPDEPYAADPTVPTTKELIYQNGELVEK